MDPVLMESLLRILIKRRNLRGDMGRTSRAAAWHLLKCLRALRGRGTRLLGPMNCALC